MLEWDALLVPFFAGALAYADDHFLLVPTPRAVLKPLSVCDSRNMGRTLILNFNAMKKLWLAIINQKAPLAFISATCLSVPVG